MKRPDLIRRGMIASGLLALSPLSLSLARAQDETPDALSQSTEILQKISSYINGLGTMQGRFSQIGPSGQLENGTFRMKRPGRIRFDYDAPSPLVIVADGAWVILQDSRLETVDRYPLRATPLKFLLSDELDLTDEKRVVAAGKIPPNELMVLAREQDGDAQGEIEMYFSEFPIGLNRWIITDAQGLQTTILLSDIERDVDLNPALFRVKDKINPFKKGP